MKENKLTKDNIQQEFQIPTILHSLLTDPEKSEEPKKTKTKEKTVIYESKNIKISKEKGSLPKQDIGELTNQVVKMTRSVVGFTQAKDKINMPSKVKIVEINGHIKALDDIDVLSIIAGLCIELNSSSQIKLGEYTTPLSIDVPTNLNRLLNHTIPAEKEVNIARLKKNLHKVATISVKYQIDGVVDYSASLMKVATNKTNNNVVVSIDRVFWCQKSYITLSVIGLRKIQNYLAKTGQYYSKPYYLIIVYISKYISENHFRDEDLTDNNTVCIKSHLTELVEILKINSRYPNEDIKKINKIFNNLKQVDLVNSYTQNKKDYSVFWNIEALKLNKQINYKRRLKRVRVG